MTQTTFYASYASYANSASDASTANSNYANYGNFNQRTSYTPLGPLDTLFSFSKICIILLMIAVLGSALAVVYVQHLNRSLHIQLQKAYELRDALHVEWSQLLLEQGTYGSDVRVERVAQERLNMMMPKPEQMLVVRPSGVGSSIIGPSAVRPLSVRPSLVRP